MLIGVSSYPQEKNKQIVALVAQQMSDALLMIVGRMG